MVRAGVLRKRVEVQKFTTTQSDEGALRRTYFTENTVWANVNPISGLERIQGDRVKDVRTHRVTMKFYSPGIDATMRLIFETRIFEIISVVNIGERGCFTVLDVKEAPPVLFG